MNGLQVRSSGITLVIADPLGGAANSWHHFPPMLPEQTARLIPAPSRQLPNGRLRHLAYWGLQPVGWSFYFWAQASGEVVFAAEPWSKAGTLWGVVCFAGIALTD